MRPFHYYSEMAKNEIGIVIGIKQTKLFSISIGSEKSKSFFYIK
jgi:hypothetical protein